MEHTKPLDLFRNSPDFKGVPLSGRELHISLCGLYVSCIIQRIQRFFYRENPGHSADEVEVWFHQVYG